MYNMVGFILGFIIGMIIALIGALGFVISIIAYDECFNNEL